MPESILSGAPNKKGPPLVALFFNGLLDFGFGFLWIDEVSPQQSTCCQG